MSWSVTTKARKFAAPGEIKAAFALARKQASGSPMSQTVIGLHERTVEDFLGQTPHDCDLGVSSSGHFEVGSGFGNARLELSVGAHVAPPPPAEPKPVTGKKALTEEDDEE